MTQKNSPKNNKMAVMPMPKLVFTMSLPLMISLLVQSLYNIVDGIFVAKISEEALTATSLAYPFQLLMVAVSVGTGVGVNAAIAHRLGAKQNKEANQMAFTGLVLSLAWTILFCLLGIFCTSAFVKMVAESGSTADLCETYLRICMTFCLGIFVETLAQRLLQATGKTFLSMISLVVGALTNIILDPIMIFGYFGFPALGISGAAIATVIGQWLGALVALVLNGVMNPEIRFEKPEALIDMKAIGAIYKVGVPTIVMQAMGSVMLTAFNSVLLPVSSTAVAFFGVYYKLQNFLFMPMNGLGQAAIPIVGFNYGAKNGERIQAAIRCVLGAGVVIGLVGTLIFMVFPRQLLLLFSASAAMLEIGVPALRIISLIFCLTSVTIIIGYCGSGLGNGVINMVAAALRQLIVLVPLAILFLKIGGLDKIWFSLWGSEVIAFGYAVIRFRIELKRKVKPLIENAAQEAN